MVFVVSRQLQPGVEKLMEKLEKQFLLDVNSLIDERLKSVNDMAKGHEHLATICRHLCVSDNAKRMRPLLCLYYYLMFEEESHQALTSLGVVAEFIHASSLLHDDIIDEADRRRGQSSANYRFGNAKAVLAGDFLLTEAFDILRGFERDLCEQAIIVVKEMTIAAMNEYSSRGRLDITSQELSNIAHGKTGVLFSWCGYASAMLAKRPEAQEVLWQAGKRIGLIFQIADDLKDFDGDKALKDVCRDLRNKEPSMPMILAINKSPGLRKEFEQAFSKDVISEEKALYLKNLVVDAGGIKEAQAMINAELDQVMGALFAYEGSKGKIKIDDWIKILHQPI